MITEEEQRDSRAYAAAQLERAGVVLTEAEQESIEVADFGLSRLEDTGLQLLVYINTARYCSKELVRHPGQTCPEHRHPRFEGTPGKEETLRCRRGVVCLYLEGEPTLHPATTPPAGRFTVFREVVLRPGDQHTVPPGVLHWFRAGNEGALITEFSSESGDELDEFTDPEIRRTTLVTRVAD